MSLSINVSQRGRAVNSPYAPYLTLNLSKLQFWGPTKHCISPYLYIIFVLNHKIEMHCHITASLQYKVKPDISPHTQHQSLTRYEVFIFLRQY